MGLCGNDVPDPAKGYVAGILADLEALPWRRMIEAAAQTGEAVDVQIPGQKGPLHLDFAGLGEADYQRQYGDAIARAMLELQREKGPEFVQQRLRELEQSDPEGFAMRQRLWESIQNDLAQAKNADRPAAEELQRLIMGELEQAGTLDPKTAQAISQGVLGQQTARGNYLGNAATSEEAMTLADASERQRAQRQQAALAFLVSGTSPEDVAYRREQQGLTNLGSFLTGQTPTSQFQQLSGAQQGAAPFMGGAPLPGVNPNAGMQGVANAFGVFNAQQNWNQQQANPWLAGLTGAAQGVNIWAGLGGGA